MKTTNMKFYDALQLDPAILKRKIAACGTRQEKLYYWTAIAVRSALIVAFAIVFISLLAAVFGSDNTPWPWPCSASCWASGLSILSTASGTSS